ncbi:hypothetical protein [Arthrobacter sp. NPDC089319]|uniref:hypothetical protein n=1 Tax=Arthrobacter sp. NPDC089319 TaxID=3155915 RepID=UPI00344677A7
MTEQRQPAGDHGGLPSAFNPSFEAPERPEARRRRPPFQGWGTAVFGAVVTAVAGTALHSQILYAEHASYPWGAAAALLFALAVMVWAGLKTRNVLMAGLTGVLAYVLVGLMALAPGTEALIVTGTSAAVELPIAVAGRIWMIGLVPATLAAMLVCIWALKPRRAKA